MKTFGDLSIDDHIYLLNEEDNTLRKGKILNIKKGVYSDYCTQVQRHESSRYQDIKNDITWLLFSDIPLRCGDHDKLYKEDLNNYSIHIGIRENITLWSDYYALEERMLKIFSEKDKLENTFKLMKPRKDKIEIIL